MIYDLSRTERQHRAINAETMPVSLLPKRCVCSKPAFAKQLAQYGVCIACQLAARIASLEPEGLVNLKFMLAGSSHRARSGATATSTCATAAICRR
jgi:hypothetical protein